MFLLVSVCHVDAHPGGHQHGVSVQISINLGKTFLRISRIRNILLAIILARVFVYLPRFISLISDFIYWTVLIFSLIYFEWRDDENQQLSFVYTNCLWNSTKHALKHCSLSTYAEHLGRGSAEITWYVKDDERRVHFYLQLLVALFFYKSLLAAYVPVIMALTCQ